VEKLIQLAKQLEIPAVFCTVSHSKFEAIAALCLLCAHFQTPANQFDLATKYDRCQSAISKVINKLVLYINEMWKHLLDFDIDYLLNLEHLAAYATAIHNSGISFKTIWAFIDCTIIWNCCPTWFQQQAYSSHKKYHALKYQVLSLPNGLIVIPLGLS